MKRNNLEVPAYFTKVQYDFDDIEKFVSRAYLFNKIDNSVYEYIDDCTTSQEDFIEEVNELLNTNLIVEIEGNYNTFRSYSFKVVTSLL